MKRERTVHSIGLFFFIILLFFGQIFFPSCSNTSAGGGNDDGSPPEPIPLLADIINNDVRLSWSPIEGATEIAVFRKTGSGTFQEIGGQAYSGESFTDDTCPRDLALTYSIRFTLDDASARDSQESNTVMISLTPIKVDDRVQATILEYQNSIKVSWDHQADADTYRLYRYQSKDDSTPMSFETANNYYDDSKASADTSYYYKVACIRDNVEFEKTDSFAMGIYSTHLDLFEPNDSKEEARQLTVGSGVQNAVIFSLPDGIGGVDSDVDWYRIEGSGVFEITIELENSLIDQGIVVEYENGDTVALSQNYSRTVTASDSMNEFRIFFQSSDENLSLIGTYTIGIKNP